MVPNILLAVWFMCGLASWRVLYLRHLTVGRSKLSSFFQDALLLPLGTLGFLLILFTNVFDIN